MVKQEWIAISYGLAFFLIYVCFIAYSITPILLDNLDIHIELPQTESTLEAQAVAYNMTNGMITQLSTVGTIFGISLILGAIGLITFGVLGSMKAAL